MAKWTKKTSYGDYNDPLQNHKFDGELHFKDAESKTVIVRTKQHELLHQCRVLMSHGKHVGSKPHYRLKNALRSLSKAKALEKAIKKALEEKYQHQAESN